MSFTYTHGAIRDNNLEWFEEHYGMDPNKFIFQHDNAAIHTAKRVQDYLKEANIKVLRWPANSPDLNPIELVWAYIKQRLDDYSTIAKDLEELFKRVEDIWNSLLNDYLPSLYEALPGKMRMLVRTKGLHSHLKSTKLVGRKNKE